MPCGRRCAHRGARNRRARCSARSGGDRRRRDERGRRGSSGCVDAGRDQVVPTRWRDVADQPGRPAPPVVTCRSLSRERSRCSTRTRAGKLIYRAGVAQWKAQQAAKRPKAAELTTNPRLRAYIEHKLAGDVIDSEGRPFARPNLPWAGRRHGPRQDRRCGVAWSPEQISSGRSAGVPVGRGGFRDPANVRRELREATGKDALAWSRRIRSARRRATILDEAALSARLVADLLGHSRPSMTQDVYMGRQAVDSEAALALQVALRDMSADRVNGGFSVAKEEGQTP